jgi:signal transduction histidine kinase
VVAVLLHRRRGLWPLPAHSSLLLFAPVAILFAGSAGLIIFRLLLRRLRRLENLASRVAAGDLTARVDDLGDDEIGRLGSRLNRMTEALAQARERLETVDSQRRRLLADISHELATPLTSIRGYTETLLDPDVPTDGDERETFLRYVLAEAERMDLLIQDLFELTRLEAGTGALQREVLDWGLLCRHTLQRYEDRFRKAGLTLRWRGESIEVPVLADGRRLEQVLENLLTNALRYVPAPGTVEVSLIPARGHDGPCLEVADDGPGIPPAELPRIFDRFYRSQEVRGSRGTGLGLAIVQEVVSRHGGSVQALPREPRGVRFLIRLPAGP